MEAWKERVFSVYRTNGYADLHTSKNELKIHDRYYTKNYLKYFPSDKYAQILELGCGNGTFYYFCNEHGYKNYHAIDGSIENIEYLKRQFGDSGKFDVGEILSYLRNCAEKYDVVVINDVIEHFSKPDIFELMDLVRAVLKNGGVFFIKTVNMANPYVCGYSRYIDITHEIGFTEASMKQLLRATGFNRFVLKGTDIYVLNPVISIFAKIISKISNFSLFVMSALYGRTTVHIFEKDILAITWKD